MRVDAFESRALEKIRAADVLYFTGGDQLHVTSLLGGSPLHETIREKSREGVIIAGISAGAAMMSSSMIISGRSDTAPRFGCLEIAPGMNLIPDSIIDSHFSERGRHGRLLCALAHYPQALGIGIDERTAIFVRGSELKVVGEGTVTIMDGSRTKHNDLPYSTEDEPIAIFDMCTHILHSGYKFDLKKRKPTSPSLRTLRAAK
jgi:cyanophycinase